MNVRKDCPECGEALTVSVFQGDEHKIVTCPTCGKNIDLDIEWMPIVHATVSTDQTDNGE